MNAEMLIMLSSIVDKMDIKEDIMALGKEEADSEEAKKELGGKILMLCAFNIYKAEKEFYKFVSAYKNCDIEEAKQVDIIEILKELASKYNIASFF